MPTEPPILVLLGHPGLHLSRINRAMVDAIAGLPEVEVRDLLERYPDFFIDVAAEQRRLREIDLLVMQYPIYWYGMPAILKHWLDSVLTRGFAYGEGGDALRGKSLRVAVSTGAPPEAYTPQGVHGYPLEIFLRPIEQTARFCGLRYLPPLVLQGGRMLPQATIDTHAAGYREWLSGYRREDPSPA